ncbi:MAG: aspartate aminotransferase family protein, partial [Chloroflexi bacterium]|nr:aspartate aminotransferase family protein [Chloroflexota bacterium]
MQIPVKGMPKEQVLGTLQAFKARDMDWKAGKVWCYVYNPGDETADLVRQAYLLFLTENGLDPSVFPSMLKLETDVVRMVATLLRGDEHVV